MLHQRFARIGRIALAITIGLAALALPRGAQAQTPALAPCPTGLAITAIAPTAAAPTTVSATLAPAALNIKAAAAADALSFHLHYYVDVDPTTTLKPGTAIPTGDPKIIHSGALAQDVGALTPGSHTVWVVVGQLSHQACGGADGNIAVGKVTFTVAAAQAAPAAAPAPAKTGSGGLVAASTSSMGALALGTIALLAIAGARLATGRRR